MLLVRGLFGGLFQIGLFATLLLVPAGTWQWPRATQFLAVYGVVLLVAIVVLARLAPASLEARLQPPAAKSQPKEDRIAPSFLFLSLLAWVLFIPIDVFRLHLLPPPSFGVSVLGAAVFFTGFGVSLATLLENAFAVPIVMDQSERGQVLVDTGLYAHIRHPLYLGFALFFIGLGLWLESYASVVALSGVSVALVARVSIEESTLRETLPGYSGYLARVRYRMVPYVW